MEMGFVCWQRLERSTLLGCAGQVGGEGGRAVGGAAVGVGPGDGGHGPGPGLGDM